MKTIIFLYLISAIIFKLWKKSQSGETEERLPTHYKDDFRGSIKESALFDKGEEIPSKYATILVIGNICTKNRTIIALDHVASFLTFGWIRFNDLIPVGEPLSLRLYFKNISKDKFDLPEGMTQFSIYYPNEVKPARFWQMELPQLPTPGENCFVDSELFFSPEVSGTHELRINGHKDLVWAGPYGISDRRYRITNPEYPWQFRFHVSSGYEYKTFIVAFIALAVAIFSMLISLLN